MCYIMKSQMFWDGNKRTGMLYANKIMIQNGKGVIAVPVDMRSEFGEKLIKYYETDNMEDIKEFIYMNCIDGIDFSKEE